MSMIKNFRNFKRVGALLISLTFLVTSVTGCSKAGAADGPKTWKIGHVRPQGTPADNDVNAFAKALNEASGGNITLEVYPSGSLGDYTVVQERVGLGDVEMQLAPTATGVDKTLGLPVAPYLVRNWEEAKEVYKKGGPLMNVVEERFEKQGIKVLASYPVYFGGIALTKKPNDPANFDVNRMKIRVPSMKAYEKSAQALGYQATPLAFSEAFTAMQTGIVDGAIGSGAEGYYSSFRDVTKYYLPVNDHFEMWYLYMSMDVYNSLSDEDKKMVEDVAAKMEADRYEVAEQQQEEFENKLREAGIEVIEFTEAEIDKMAQKARTEVWPVIAEEYGAEIFDEVTKDLK